MAIMFPDSLTVECDGCGEEKEFNVTEFAGEPQSIGIDDSTLTEEGWSHEGSEVFCPDCKDTEEEDG